MKACKRCGIDKHDEEFFYSKKRDKLTELCRECHKRPQSPLTWAERQSKQKAHEVRSCQYRNTVSPRPTIREQYLKRSYGLTVAEVEAMYEEQGGLCRICRTPTGEALNIDHCHATGKVRGLLCRRCNTLLGSASDDVLLLQACINYLQEWRA